MYAFEFVKPKTVEEAVAALGAEEAQALGGGQTLMPTLRQRLAQPATLVALSGIASMKGVAMKGAELAIGGGTTHATVAREAKAHYPALASLASRIGDPHVRNRGTIGGSLANNDPSACYPAAALASGATIVTHEPRDRGRRLLRGHVRDRARARRDHHRGARSRSPRGRATRSSSSRPRASRWSRSSSRSSRDGVRVAVTGASESGVFRWTEAEAALSGELLARGGQGDEATGGRHDRRPARDARVPGASRRRADRAGRGAAAWLTGARRPRGGTRPPARPARGGRPAWASLRRSGRSGRDFDFSPPFGGAPGLPDRVSCQYDTCSMREPALDRLRRVAP